ncbi:tRNA pseudouridine(55) synthase TruB [bacterium]|nr:tRNA pseudouridine(55) synthase TruB [bacterium]MBU1634391.1 tRNA pseudouridine(55) synthase TruB [bacterium]MBU1874326.1 tRNA pseudouridine(55) synthase TruB [bacterium]
MNPEIPGMILNVNKPVGLTSYDVVRQVKRLMPGVKVGHGGTLDPFARGVLLLLIGKATKQMSNLLKNQKSYEALLKLGTGTATGDNTSPVNQTSDVPEISNDMIHQLEAQFTGEITQVPPMFSAKKVNGRPAYKYAREGQDVQLKPTTISIYDLKIEIVERNLLKMNVTCSSGTYIRVLGEDVAKAVGSCGHLISLQRTAIGDYRIEDSAEIETLSDVLPELAAARA